ncbi:hypothetical protein CYR55_16935 [Chimaeribacter californicus]|jgi:hypothetical protein|uniref:DUF3811 domain-containing protein n=1 Tax=Chimaeribacter californicus TaxID=2060067 RepID=A0A2N5DZJ6_9GAMM|nr:hypothetical protein [Chimaeribacter californicus]PLR33274.1 hypothetical protein CYR55_16935 [Chimaeribacter californicus]
MKDKKMISIDQFTADERLTVDETVRDLVQKHLLRTGKAPDSKKEKELIAEARETVMAAKLAKEKAKAVKKPVRKKKPSALTASEVGDFNWSASVERGKR